MNRRLAGDAQGASPGSSVRVGDTGQSPDAMSLFTWSITVVSVVVSSKTLVLYPGSSPAWPTQPSTHHAATGRRSADVLPVLR